MAMGYQMIIASLYEDVGFDNEVLAVAMRQYVERIAAHFEKLLQPEIEGNQLVIQLQQDGSGVAAAGGAAGGAGRVVR